MENGIRVREREGENNTCRVARNGRMTNLRILGCHKIRSGPMDQSCSTKVPGITHSLIWYIFIHLFSTTIPFCVENTAD